MTDPIVLLQILWTGIGHRLVLRAADRRILADAKVTGLWNFAQAGMMGIAFYAMYFLLNDLGQPLFVALPAAAALAAATGIAIEVWGLDVLRARGSGNLTFFIFTLILAELIIYILTLLFGTEPQTLFPSILSPVHIIGGIAISDWDLWAVGITVGALVALQLFLRCEQRRPVPDRCRRQCEAGGAVRHQREAGLLRDRGDCRRADHVGDVPARRAQRSHAQ